MQKFGGGMNSTLLWTNPSPTADFAEQTVTLSESISDGDFVLFNYKRNKSDTKTYSFIIPVATLLEAFDNYAFVFGGGGDGGFARWMSAHSASQINISAGKAVASTGSFPAYIIPVSIYKLRGKVH